MKRIFLLIALLAVAFLEMRQLFTSPSQNQKQTEVTGEATATATITGGEIVSVAFVIDGDTIDLTDGRRVRYIGIDAPEISHAQKSSECFATAAKEENERLVQGKQVRLEKDISDTDSYGRLLRYVVVGDTLVNEFLVTNGFARAWSVPPDVKNQQVLVTAQESAQNAHRGLWQLCKK